VGYDSQTLNDAKRGYDIHDRELLAVIQGLLAWRHLLVGSPHKICVLTDHSNLKYYRHPQKISRRVARYLPKMAKFDFELIYKPGSTNKADHLSRRPDHDDSSLDNQDVTVLPPHLFIHASTVSDLEQLVLDAQLAHLDLLHTWASRFNLTESDSAWYRGSALVVVEDNDLRREVSSLYHDHRLAGHPGISKTLDLLTRDYWWPTVKDFVTSYVKVLRFPGHAPVGLTAPDEEHRRRREVRSVRPCDRSDTTRAHSRPVWPRHYDDTEQRCERPALVRP
jgi:RNase H-like domain found in reverse transcriptase/Integrase zinc binding domain